MQHLHLDNDSGDLAKYHAYLQSDHDWEVWVDVLTINEQYVDTMDLLDGQINYDNGDEGPHRTSSITLSDPQGALDFGESYLYDPKGIIWVNRLLQIWHRVTVPTVGDVTTSCGIYLPTAVARDGAEISLEMGDKSLLADHGVRPRTFRKGMRVDEALVSVLEKCTGEKNFRIPTTNATLSKSYTVGMGEDSLTPWDVFKKIAAVEMDWRAFYDGEGFATCEPVDVAKRAVVVDSLLALPKSTASFTDFVNYARVTSHRKPRNKKGKVIKNSKITLIHDSVVALPKNHDQSEQSLARNTVPRTLPIVEVNDNLKNLAATLKRAKNLLISNSGTKDNRSHEIIPFFHLEPFDMVHLPENIGKQRLFPASIPLGVGGNMTIGSVKWVSKPSKVKQIRSKTTKKKKKKRGGKK